MNAYYRVDRTDSGQSFRKPITLDRGAIPRPRAIERPRGVDLVAAFASLTIAAGAFGSFMVMTGNGARPVERPIMIVQLANLQPPPPPHTAPPVARALPRTIVPPAPAALKAPAVPTITAAAEPTPSAPTAPDVVEVAAPAPAPAPAAAPAASELSARLLVARPPTYPLESRRLGEHGTVVLALLLSTEGRVQDISIAHSSGFYRLDNVALAAVRRWRWSPTIVDGAPALVRGLVTIPFVLDA